MDEEAQWSVYLVECSDGTLYCGISNDVPARIAAHDAGKGARYTRGRGPVRLVWREDGLTRAAAARREHEVKRLPRAEKLILTL